MQPLNNGMNHPVQPTPPSLNFEGKQTSSTPHPAVSSTHTEVAQTDIGSQFTAEFHVGCAKQSQRESVMADIIARIAAGEPAMIVFCEEENVGEFAAFKLEAHGGRLHVAEYD